MFMWSRDVTAMSERELDQRHLFLECCAVHNTLNTPGRISGSIVAYNIDEAT